MLIDSATSSRQEDQRTHGFEKKYSIKREMDLLWTSRNITSLNESCYKTIDSPLSQNVFSYQKMFRMQCRKNITVEYNIKRMNIANFINIYRNIYTCIICDENDSK